MTTLQVDRGNIKAAFSTTEKSRSRILAEATATAGAHAINLDNLGGLLPAGVALVEFTVTKERWFAWVITKEDSRFVARQKSEASLVGLVRSYRAAIQKGDEDEMTRFAEDLYDELIRPLHLPAGMSLLIAPDGILRWVPFAALQNRVNGRFLVEEFEIASTPSATYAIKHSLLTGSVPTSVLVVGNPATKHTDGIGIGLFRVL